MGKVELDFVLDNLTRYIHKLKQLQQDYNNAEDEFSKCYSLFEIELLIKKIELVHEMTISIDFDDKRKIKGFSRIFEN